MELGGRLPNKAFPAARRTAEVKDRLQARGKPLTMPAGAADLGLLDADRVLTLQASAGNAAVTQLVQRAPANVDPYTADEATDVEDSWTKGAYADTETADDLETQAYMQWRDKARPVVAKLKKSKTAADKTRATELTTWLSSFEARQHWLLRNTPAPAVAGKPPVLAKGEPADPGATPKELTDGAGALPSPAFRIVHQYDVTMPDGGKYRYRDDPIKRSYKYMTTETGIDHMGVSLAKRTDVATLFTLAGITDVDQQLAIKKVSGKEAGFEGINTYDTGFVSVGMIQFTTTKSGDGTIVGLMKTAKTIDPAGYKTYFHDLGLDVGKKNGKDILVVVDPATGTILRGDDAVQAVINDKRLSAVFQNAGENWQNFRVAELQAAIANYWQTGKSFSVKVDHTNPDGTSGKLSLSGTLGDVLQSQAGKTALLDRSVQFGPGGAYATFVAACQKIAKNYKPQSLEELAKFEMWIIKDIQNRIDVLNEKDLTQPAPPPIGDFPTTSGDESGQPALAGVGAAEAV